MDKLSHLISKAVDVGEWKSPTSGKNGPAISHLMFADDLILFGQANESQMRRVLNILQEFCSLSGQQVSQPKTSIPISRNVPLETRRVSTNISGFKESP